MLKVLFLVVASAGAACVDTPGFLDQRGAACSSYAGMDCRDAAGLSALGLTQVLENCQATCDSCVKAADFCEVGIGGDQWEPAPRVSTFDFYDQEFINDSCDWEDSPNGLRMTSNAWGNQPGQNFVMGCMALLKDVEYTDFVMEITASHDDNDAFGFIFGFEDERTYYQTWVQNDNWWPPNPTDKVPGTVLKVARRAGKECFGVMNTTESLCYETLAYNANSVWQPAAEYPNGKVSSVPYYPKPYFPAFDPILHLNYDGRTATNYLVVSQGQVRTYFYSENNLLVGTWADLPADYAGGQIGIFVSAHQPEITNIKVADISAAAAPMTSKCKAEGATCDPNVGVCVGGPTFAPTATPTMSPTFLEDCKDPFRHPASDFCPNPVGGTLKAYDVSDAAAWDFVQQQPSTGECDWTASAQFGLRQSSNAWGNYPGDNTLTGCLALIPDSYTDFIAEFEAVHDDNDGWGFVFGYNSDLDHYMAATINDIWPSPPADGVSGPHTKIKKANGQPCLGLMNASYNCYDTLGWTSKNGYMDMDTVPRAKEYEYYHGYEGGGRFQPHKLTLIVSGQEARLLYKSPEVDVGTPQYNIRQATRWQSAQVFDLQGYAGGRIGAFTYAHQLNITSFNVTDLSDPANLPTAYCGAAAGAFCDAGVTGLCLAVAASGVCEGAVDPDVYDTTDVEAFDYVDDDFLGSECAWGIGPNGVLRQSSNANRYDGTMLGCNALAGNVSYTDFVLEVWMSNQDNDGVGLNFGWKGPDDHFRVHKINDQWNVVPSDDVMMPVWKIRRRVPGRSCEMTQNATDPKCYETIGFIDVNGPWNEGMPGDALVPQGECGYSSTYLSYEQGERSKLYLIVKDNQMRATYESPLSRRQVTVMNFDLSKYDYSGGRVGIFMAAHQAEIYSFTVASLLGPDAVTQFCNGDLCSERTGRCLGSPTQSPTEVPTKSPTVFPTPNVAANEYCQGPVSATATTVVDTTDISQFDLVEHPLLTAPCAWAAAADGLTQSSTAWGNSPGDNTLMGCMAIFNGATFTDFIAEVDVTHIDNDGWGIVFGYNAVDDHYLGIAMNDRWPLPAADGISGPFLKIKKHNGKEVLPNMDASNTCFDKLSHLDSSGFDGDAMQGSTGVGIPKEYEATYPYRRGAIFDDTKIVLIVANGEARLYYPTPDLKLDQAVNGIRQSNTVTSTWTFDLKGYSGGQVGVFTYAHEATFSNWKITDLSDPSAIADYCDGQKHVKCDNDRGDASTGLCLAVPISDVCEGPVGAGVTYVDTTDLSVFEYLEDPLVTDGPCTWVLGGSGNIRQTSNADAVNSNLVQGCNANVKGLSFVDFVMQVDFDNDDNDVAGLNFGWKSHEDYFRMHKHNDGWPNPSADLLPGPIMKVLRKMPDVPCDIFDPDYTNTCYQTLSYIDLQGAFHNGLGAGVVAPFEYSRTYLPFSQTDIKRMVLIIKDQSLRVMYEDLDVGRVVANFIMDLSPFNYSGGQVGLFTAAHQAEFSNFIIGELSGPNAVTTFCDGGICDERLGLCTTSPTQNPTARTGDVAAAGICPGPVGGNTIEIDTADITQFTIVDQDPITEPCAWSASAAGLRQSSNAWGNAPGDNTLMGCIAIIGTETYTDFIIEVSAIHDDDDAWGFVFGYDVSSHFIAVANNDKWPDPAADGVMGPFTKLKKANGKPCLAEMDETNNCYDTISFSDVAGRFNSDNKTHTGKGRFVVDGDLVTDLPGEYSRTYPYKVDTDWEDRKMTLIVKDGEARLQLLGPGAVTDAPLNNLRQPTTYAATWTYDLANLGYTGGRIGLFLYAHQATFTNLTITDLSDSASLPTAYCNGEATCTASGACVAVAAPDVCAGAVGATSVDMTVANSFDYVGDPLINAECAWNVATTARGTFLAQTSNANTGGASSLQGCNAILKAADFTDFILETKFDNGDNDGVGLVFGWKSLDDHWKLHKINDIWPTPAADGVTGPGLKVKRKIPGRICNGQNMNASTNCFQTIAFADGKGVYHDGLPPETVTPWQYARKYIDYSIGSGGDETTMVLIVKDNQLRTYFTSPDFPSLKVPLFIFDLAQYSYAGGRVGLFTFAHQAQWFDFKIAALSGANAATEFCANGGTCNTDIGLCE